MNEPIDVPTRETAEFVAAHVPPRAAILEVGCGAGHVAVELSSRGYQVLGVDSDEDVIARAQARGAPVVQASWPDFRGAPVDAVVFTRSLHHIHPLREAVSQSRAILRPAGTLLVEDFAFDEADPVTITWFLKILGGQAAQALIASIPDAFVTKLLASPDPAAEWHKNHDHELHPVSAMTGAIAEYFTLRDARSAPYLYRYLIPVLPETPEATAFVEEVRQEEARLGERGEITLIGRRLVGSAQES